MGPVARPVYSQQFISYTDSAPNTSFEVPNGFVAVIRDIISYTELGDLQIQCFYQDVGGAPPIIIYSENLAGALQYDKWEGRVVVPESGVISIVLSSVSLSSTCYVGGYLLSA